tara:strand:- start:103 stop:531 length:429 start_codon:yes stop_codon:yes gene_type:complete
MRNKKISADISIEAKLLLDAVCKKHDRSKGFLLEKMIRKFCSDEVTVTTPPTSANIATVEKKPVKRFVPPNVEQVFQYCNERCNNVDAQNFVDHYTANGWMRGKVKVKDWKACVRTWEKSTINKQQGKTSGNLSACEDFING